MLKEPEKRIIRYRIAVSGRVQGVGFRRFVMMSAIRNDVTGYAKNLYDGTVELELQGEPVKVCAVIEDIKEGNRFIDARKLDITEIPPDVHDSDFEIKYF